MHALTLFSRHDPTSHLYPSEYTSTSDGVVLLKFKSLLNNKYWLIGVGSSSSMYSDVQRVSNLINVHHLLTRVVYEYPLRDDRLPASSILSPLNRIVTPRPIYVYTGDLRIPCITSCWRQHRRNHVCASILLLYVSMITYHGDALFDCSALHLATSWYLPGRMIQRSEPRRINIGTLHQAA